MAKVHAIGMPENDSERKAIAYLAKHLSDDYVIFHNLELPTPAGLPYEYDAIVVGTYAVYVVEIKGYKGLIRGNAHEWELESKAITKSPIPLANKKAKVVADRLHVADARLNQVWVQSLIVLTDVQARVRLNDEQASRVLHLDDVATYMDNPHHLPIHSQSISGLHDLISNVIIGKFRPLRRQHEIGDYLVQETLGKNQLYSTLLAEHRLIRTQSRFTLKVYIVDIYASSEVQHKQQEWMLRDANALYRLTGHPNIVQAYHPFPWQAHQFVLPVAWVDGYSLRGILDTGTRPDFRRSIEIVREVCSALHFAHAHGVIHRDVRPDNIIVPHSGPVKLVNFDCARVEGDSMPSIRTRVGRMLDERYVAPEVWLDAGAASFSSDMYAAGIVLFELLTGQPPYQTFRDLRRAGGLPQQPSAVNPSLSADVDEVIGKMCAFDVEERYLTIETALEYLAIIG